VRLVIEPYGHVSRVAADGAPGSDETHRCVERAVAVARFPRFAGPPMRVGHPFVYRGR